ncbi:hypothetical protein K8352_16545 [Flavobacteriaceae bacterium F89]|uniref:Uncharacterized protein n=1 Tax=Cerina litoralis TaxID=2874477 RepID=A0AAE3EWI1_9FLAO|nr:DUF6786 family protein [Cerina litoralis]MCG2462372.1 hypothetical protein [Cerina litoralis]
MRLSQTSLQGRSGGQLIIIDIYRIMCIKKLCITMGILALLSCGGQQTKKDIKMEKPTYEKGSLGYDQEFLENMDKDLVILQSGSAVVLVSPKYQAKVFTSSATRERGKSLGWINYKAFQGDLDPHMNAYGGENRFWLGPEGGKFSLFFEQGQQMTFDNWKTPPPIDSEIWKVADKSVTGVRMEKEMSLRNYADTQLDIKVVRNVQILDAQQIENLLHIDLGQLEFVGYKTSNEIINTGQNSWTEETGAPCIWMLDMFPPSDRTTIVIPYREDASGKVATTDYFGEIPEDRIEYADNTIFFKADGKSRGKLGVPPQRAKNVAGSYDATNQLLTITIFDVERDAVYLNQEWTPDKDPFTGDAINAYNDGPLEDGSQMGPFYEIESVSPAAFLNPGEKMAHDHSVFHFAGTEDKLDVISKEVFGVSLEVIKDKF